VNKVHPFARSGFSNQAYAAFSYPDYAIPAFLEVYTGDQQICTAQDWIEHDTHGFRDNFPPLSRHECDLSLATKICIVG
jgi:hypothetical protein|tara:strand:+ start:341 stop:577 length:237 start_codon:yes stop_codon:yes gene_type:complete